MGRDHSSRVTCSLKWGFSTPLRSPPPHPRPAELKRKDLCEFLSNFCCIRNLVTHLSGLGSDLLVILLKGGKILTGLGELSLLHTLSDVPVDEGTL